MAKNIGFTLVECLVALFIVAVVLASATRAIGVVISDVEDTFIREVATWVAENEYNFYKIEGKYPNLGVVKKTIPMAGLEFAVTETISETVNPYFRKIEIEVSTLDKPGYAIFKTVSFIAQY